MIATAPAATVLEEAVQKACRAPSLHNSQPWRWVADGSSLQLYSDGDRLLPFTDAFGRQLLISCGAVLDHFRCAMAAVGWRTQITRFPNPNRRDLLADITFHRADFVTDAERDRADAIDRRRTDRLPFEEPSGWAGFEPILRDTIDNEDVVLHVLPADAQAQLAEATKLTAALRRYDSMYHAELQWWTGHSVVFEGVPRDALVSQAETERVPVGRQFPTTEHQSRRAGTPDDHSTVLALTTDTDEPRDLLRTGEILSTILLECTMAGYATCTLTHVTEVPKSRSIIRSLVGHGEPQVLVRVGIAPQSDETPAATPRRPLFDVLTVENATRGRA